MMPGIGVGALRIQQSHLRAAKVGSAQRGAQSGRAHARDLLAQRRDVAERADERDGREPERDERDAAEPGRDVAEARLVCAVLAAAAVSRCTSRRRGTGARTSMLSQMTSFGATSMNRSAIVNGWRASAGLGGGSKDGGGPCGS